MDHTKNLNAAFKTGDHARVCAAIFALIQGTGNVKAFALKAGLDRTMLYRTFKRNTHFDIVLKVMLAADLKLATVDHPIFSSKPSSLSRKLNAAFDSADVVLIVKALSETLRAQENVTLFAKKVEVRRETLYKTLTFPHVPRLGTVLSFLNALDLRLKVASKS